MAKRGHNWLAAEARITGMTGVKPLTYNELAKRREDVRLEREPRSAPDLVAG